MLPGLFITGTDTACGKTHATSLILRALRQNNRPALPYKPVCCGDRMDIYHLIEACDGSSFENETADTFLPDRLNPLWLKTPAAPIVASQFENLPADIDTLTQAHRDIATAHPHHLILTEGAGGWDVPLTADSSMSHLAQSIGHPILLIIGNRLGALNHTLLTLRAIKDSGLPVAGLIINQIQEEQDVASVSNRSTLQQLTSTPILGEIMHNATHLEEELTENLLKLI